MLGQDLESVTVKPLLSLSTPRTTNIVHIITSSILSQESSTTLLTESQLNLSSTESFQNTSDLLSSNLSSTAHSPLPSVTSNETTTTLVHLAFLVLLILVSIFVLIQCSHFMVYVTRLAFKDRDSGLI